MWGLEEAEELLLGCIIMANAVVVLFFIKYWKMTGDRFFLFFAWAFVLEAVCRVILAAYVVNSESEPLVYSIRLLAYSLILAGILDKNRVSIRKYLFQRTSR
ncbi:conserved membrane hypothetical protein [Candidatus Nitrospira nitrificans]|uniref:Uncharacterized protein n=2 Tax=Candidatus Nitrospira nitrificans TaxID=1742973 RepID=A0A0S4LT31_9BACT|nr:conserved membrane hypothetical protein [Candidatus Nitrospira nitrificans]